MTPRVWCWQSGRPVHGFRRAPSGGDLCTRACAGGEVSGGGVAGRGGGGDFEKKAPGREEAVSGGLFETLCGRTPGACRELSFQQVPPGGRRGGIHHNTQGVPWSQAPRAPGAGRPRGRAWWTGWTHQRLKPAEPRPSTRACGGSTIRACHRPQPRICFSSR